MSSDRLVEPTFMAQLRQRADSLASGNDWSRCDDHHVVAWLEAVQGRQADGTPVQGPTPLFAMALLPAAAPPPPPAPAAASPRPARAAAAPPAEGTFTPQLDLAAMVAVLQQAARDGVPFCEECARAAAEAAA